MSFRTIDLLDWNSLINNTTKISNLLMVPNLEVSETARNQYSKHLPTGLGSPNHENWQYFKHWNTPPEPENPLTSGL